MVVNVGGHLSEGAGWERGSGGVRGWSLQQKSCCVMHNQVFPYALKWRACHFEGPTRSSVGGGCKE